MTRRPALYWQGLGKHLVDNAPSVVILINPKNPVDARDKKYRQRAGSLSLAGALAEVIKGLMVDLINIMIITKRVICCLTQMGC